MHFIMEQFFVDNSQRGFPSAIFWGVFVHLSSLVLDRCCAQASVSCDIFMVSKFKAWVFKGCLFSFDSMYPLNFLLTARLHLRTKNGFVRKVVLKVFWQFRACLVLLNLRGPFNLGSLFWQNSGRWWGGDESLFCQLNTELVEYSNFFNKGPCNWLLF